MNQGLLSIERPGKKGKKKKRKVKLFVLGLQSVLGVPKRWGVW